LTPPDSNDCGRAGSQEWAGALACRLGLRLGGAGAVGVAQEGSSWLVNLACGPQEQATDLGQICSWAVTQPGVQLALVFAASF